MLFATALPSKEGMPYHMASGGLTFFPFGLLNCDSFFGKQVVILV